jgi:two-component system LytT family response regulator
MKAVIIEDEIPAAEKLKKALLHLDPNMQVLAVLGSVKASAGWLTSNGFPDLLFMDIELSDGLSFQLFDSLKVECPVIFTTAYDEYWQEAFEHNSIDYLLKPIKEEKLAQALSKYEQLKRHFTVNMQKLADWQHGVNGTYKKRLLVKRGADYFSIRAEDIAYFYAVHKLVCLVDHKGQKFILDQSLADLEKQTNPSLFYRVNRKYLVNMNAIKRIRVFPKSKLALEMEPAVQEEVIVSQEKAAEFKAWMEG